MEQSTGFDMGVYQKLLIVTIVAPQSCPSFKLSRDKSFCISENRWVRPVTKFSQSQNAN